MESNKSNRGKGKRLKNPYTEEHKAINRDEPIREDEVEFDIVEDEDVERTTFLPMTGTPEKVGRKKKLRLEGVNQSMDNPYSEDDLKERRETDETPRSGGDSSSKVDSLGKRVSEKTGWMVSSIAIAKSFFGIGSLAIPWGFHLCGFQLALALISVNAAFSFFTCWVLVEAQRFFGGGNVRTFADLGMVCFGTPGYVLVSSLYFLNQVMTGVAYVLFFFIQVQSILPETADARIALALLASVLIPAAVCLRSMRGINWLQTVALFVLGAAIGQVWLTCMENISSPRFEKHYTHVDYWGLPYFFGICCFAFEGNTVTLEIYRGMEHRRRDFNKALGFGLAIATGLFQLTGIFFYRAFAQYTGPQLIGNLPEHALSTYFVKAGYAVGVTAGFFLQIAPLFNLFDKYIMLGESLEGEYIDADTPERRRAVDIRRKISFILRGAIAFITCVLGYIAGDFAMFLNLQGALVGTFISYILPCAFYLRMITYARALRAKDKDEASEGLMAFDKEADGDPDFSRLATLDSGAKKAGLRGIDIHTDKLDPETRLEFWQTMLCYTIITFGTVGGSVSLACTTTHIGQNLF